MLAFSRQLSFDLYQYISKYPLTATNVYLTPQILNFRPMQITDDNDPFFVYILDVGEQDYHILKRDQALLVEFPAFPAKLIELVNECLKSDTLTCFNSAKHAGEEFKDEPVEPVREDLDVDASTFYCRLDTNSGVMQLVEANKFKQVVHISLQMRQGNDAAIKTYLASRLKLALSQCTALSSELNSTTRVSRKNFFTRR